MGAVMEFRVKIALLAVAFSTAFLCDGATAATYFTVAKSGITPVTTPVTGPCQDFNNQVAGGVTLHGVNHPNYCQFSSAQVVFNGLPFDQYWQAVSIGAVPAPFKVTYTHGPRFEQCGTLASIEEQRSSPIEVSMHIPTYRLDWSAAAASVGPSCLAEWTRHTFVTLASDTANFTSASNIVRQLVSTLNIRIPKKYKSCASIGTPEGGSVQKQILVSFVAMFKNSIANDVKNAETSWSPQGVSGNDCNLHCSVCSPGWAGTLTCRQLGNGTDNAGHAIEYDETQNWYVGGTSGTTIAAPWTAVGKGSHATGGGWTTNNAAQASFGVITNSTTG